MQLDEADGEWQTETGAGVLAVPGAGDLAEASDRGGDLVGIHADAAIDHIDIEAVTAQPPTHQHATAGMAELDGVGDEIEHDLLQLERVGTHRRKLRWNLVVDAH